MQKHKLKIDELSSELERGATERVNLEANLAHLTNKLLMVSLSLPRAIKTKKFCRKISHIKNGKLTFLMFFFVCFLLD